MPGKASRKVYIVQRLHWVYQDDFFNIEDESPVKAFMRLSQAEGYRQKLEHVERENWSPERDRLRRGDTLQFFEVVSVEVEAES